MFMMIFVVFFFFVWGCVCVFFFVFVFFLNLFICFFFVLTLVWPMDVSFNHFKIMHHKHNGYLHIDLPKSFGWCFSSYSYDSIGPMQNDSHTIDFLFIHLKFILTLSTIMQGNYESNQSLLCFHNAPCHAYTIGTNSHHWYFLIHFFILFFFKLFIGPILESNNHRKSSDV